MTRIRRELALGKPTAYGEPIHLRQRDEVSATWWRALRVGGSALLVASGAIHLDLYLTGYRTIPTIGWLFLLQVITAFGLAALVALSGSSLVPAMGAVLAMSTLIGYLVSLRHALFGFREVRTTAGVASGVIEIVAFAVLAAIALGAAVRSPKSRSTRAEGSAGAGHPALLRAGRWCAGVVAAGASSFQGRRLRSLFSQA